jgi:DNA-binding MarR family transcriptional regulator
MDEMEKGRVPVVKEYTAKLRVETKFEYIRKHLEITNVLLIGAAKMAPREMDLIAAFLLNESYLNSTIGVLQSKDARKKVMEELNMSTAQVSNILRGLKGKNLVYKEGKNLKFRDYLSPRGESQTYKFQLNYDQAG